MKTLIFLNIFFVLVTSTANAEGRRMNAMDVAKQEFEKSNYVRALDLFDKIIRSKKYADYRNEAFYYQGLSLYELGFHYASYLSFRNVFSARGGTSKQLFEKAIKNAVVITNRLGMVERVGKTLTTLPDEYIPNSVMHLAHYAKGVYFFRIGKPEIAEAHFKSVHPQSPFYMQSLFHLGVIATGRANYKDASFYFKKVATETSRRKEDNNLRELAKLNLARVVYSAGDIETSIRLFANFTSSSPYWVTVLLEASWPLMRVSDTTVSLGNLHTITSPFYREDLVGEAYVLRATILFALCKYEEMRKTLSQFFEIYDPVLQKMQNEKQNLKSPKEYFDAFTNKSMNRSFVGYVDRDPGLKASFKALEDLKTEYADLSQYTRNVQVSKIRKIQEQTMGAMAVDIGITLRTLHSRKLEELLEQREQANYLKVEIVTGEKELIEAQKGLPPKRITDVETSVDESYQFWPFRQEYWEDELGSYVYTTESACVN